MLPRLIRIAARIAVVFLGLRAAVFAGDDGENDDNTVINRRLKWMAS
jgi:hypothetical protein